TGLPRNIRTGLPTSESDGYAHSVQVGTKIRSWQVTPRGDFKADRTVDGAGRVSQDTQSQAYSVILRLDKSYPQGYRIPFTRKTFGNVNRLIIDGTVGFERRKSAVE